MKRALKNLTTTRFALCRAFPKTVLDALEEAIRNSENQHGGEIRFAVETALDIGQLWHGVTARDEAVLAFADLRVWDTAKNCGVLIYVLLAEHAIEIVADRGYDGCVSEAEWRTVCSTMEAAFADRQFARGSLDAVAAVAHIIQAHFPYDAGGTNELPDRPVLL
ncbi:MAG TPA: TPM domain-containing protein [Woeseiaceae bacterium]|nr:TPM domain-containing protein [Woeseiaceae bacterium]